MGALKILAINFKYLGDVAIMIPSLRAIKNFYPDCELHVLVAEEAVPILKHNPWIERVWGFPRRKKGIKWSIIKDIIHDLRAQRFDRSVDFIGNDRGAILSRLIGANIRLGLDSPKGFFGRKWCYTEAIEPADDTRHEIIRTWNVLKAWRIPFFKQTPRIEIYPDPDLEQTAEKLLPERSIVCHLSTSQQKKEWAIENWCQLYGYLSQLSIPTVFTSGHSLREQNLLVQLKQRLSYAKCLPKFNSLDLFIATLSRSYCLISPDTAPLHIATGLGIPTIGMFGSTASSRWAPIGKLHQALQGGLCPCSGHLHVCEHSNRCIDEIKPDQVWKALQNLLKVHPITLP